MVRRDNCKWAKTVYERVLKGLLYEMSETKCRQYLEEELAKAFELFDEEGTGKISVRNLRHIAKELAGDLISPVVKPMIST